MNFYERRILPRLVQCVCGARAIAERRARLIPSARGRVLEIGIGSGVNAPFYDVGRVERLWGLDPSSTLRKLAGDRMARRGIPFEFIGLSGEQIPLDDASMDTIVTTYTLCSIPDVDRALAEMRRVLKPGGTLLFSEHGRAPDADARRWQRRLNPIWKRVAGGCHLDRDMPALIRRGGFALERLETGYLRGPRPMTFNYLGSAVPDG